MPAKAVLAVLFALLLSPSIGLSQTGRTLYVGLVSVTPTNASVLAAVDGGYFKKHGLDVKALIMAGSSTAESNPKAKNVHPEDIGDNSILKEIEASGFVKQLGAAQ